MSRGSGPCGRYEREAHRVRFGAGVPRPLRSDPGTEELCAICFGCGLERTDSPLVHRDRLVACLVCGDTRLIIDVRPARPSAGAPPPIEHLPPRDSTSGRRAI
jgi:hypothetical protein